MTDILSLTNILIGTSLIIVCFVISTFLFCHFCKHKKNRVSKDNINKASTKQDYFDIEVAIPQPKYDVPISYELEIPPEVLQDMIKLNPSYSNLISGDCSTDISADKRGSKRITFTVPSPSRVKSSRIANNDHMSFKVPPTNSPTRTNDKVLYDMQGDFDDQTNTINTTQIYPLTAKMLSNDFNAHNPSHLSSATAPASSSSSSSSSSSPPLLFSNTNQLDNKTKRNTNRVKRLSKLMVGASNDYGVCNTPPSSPPPLYPAVDASATDNKSKRKTNRFRRLSKLMVGASNDYGVCNTPPSSPPPLYPAVDASATDNKSKRKTNRFRRLSKLMVGASNDYGVCNTPPSSPPPLSPAVDASATDNKSKRKTNRFRRLSKLMVGASNDYGVCNTPPSSPPPLSPAVDASATDNKSKRKTNRFRRLSKLMTIQKNNEKSNAEDLNMQPVQIAPSVIAGIEITDEYNQGNSQGNNQRVSIRKSFIAKQLEGNSMFDWLRGSSKKASKTIANQIYETNQICRDTEFTHETSVDSVTLENLSKKYTDSLVSPRNDNPDVNISDKEKVIYNSEIKSYENVILKQTEHTSSIQVIRCSDSDISNPRPVSMFRRPRLSILVYDPSVQ